MVSVLLLWYQEGAGKSINRIPKEHPLLFLVGFYDIYHCFSSTSFFHKQDTIKLNLVEGIEDAMIFHKSKDEADSWLTA